MDNIKILFADPFPILRGVYKKEIEKSIESVTIIEVNSFADLFNTLDNETFNVLLLNDVLLDGHITDNIEKLGTYKGLKRIMFTLDKSSECINFAIMAFDGMIIKAKTTDQLIKAIKEVLNGGTFYPPIPEDETEIPILMTKSKSLIRKTDDGIKKAFFTDIPYLGKELTCRICETKTFYGNFNKFRFDTHSKYQWWYQCQSCGKTTTGEMGLPAVDFLEIKCECGGEFRRDKPLFCPNCKGNKEE